ncbi:ERF family protein [Pseudomonas sp. zbq_18]|uniref:ERF family protein n=1 Tax=Pseudomonas sp. zbq_18 TaxID=3367251 RepID=UPI00370A31C2
MQNAPILTQDSAAQAPVLADTQEASTILAVIGRAATDPNCDIDKMERLGALYERLKAGQAQQAYTDALANLQQELPVIRERGAITNKNGDVQSTYALWEDVNEAIKPVLARHGFSLSFRIPRNEKGIEVEAVLSHRYGHSERTSILLPADTTGSKNAVQAVASSVAYGKRYTAFALVNITTTGEDDDGQSACQQPAVRTITPVQAARFVRLRDQCGPKLRERLLADWPDPQAIPADDFDPMMASIERNAQRYQDHLNAQQGEQQ